MKILFIFSVKLYAEKCAKLSECDTTKGLYCRDNYDNPCNCPIQSKFQFCDCQIGFHWNYSTNNCEKCLSNEYYNNYALDPTLARCNEKLTENVTCNDSFQCYEPMNCIVSLNNSTCLCNGTQYHSFSTLDCVPQKSINGTCSVDFNCRVDQYLECKSNKCKCIPKYPLWSESISSIKYSLFKQHIVLYMKIN